MHDKIKTGFSEYFSDFGTIELPATIPERGEICAMGWSINYILSIDENGKPCLTFWAEHRMTNPRHVRINSDGEIIGLESFLESYSFDPKVDGSEEDAHNRFKEHNQRVGELLRAEGLS
jgi:hypothetical protein